MRRIGIHFIIFRLKAVFGYSYPVANSLSDIQPASRIVIISDLHHFIFQFLKICKHYNGLEGICKCNTGYYLSQCPKNLFLFADFAVKFFITNLACTEKVGLDNVGLVLRWLSQV